MITTLFQNLPFGALGLLVFGAIVFITNRFAWDESTRQTTALYLMDDNFGSTYNRWIDKVLDQLDENLSPDEIELPKNSIARSFSYKLLNLNLSVAFIYPVSAFLFNWVYSGDGSLAGNQILSELSPNQRYLEVISIVFCYILLLLSLISQTRLQYFWLLCSIATLGVITLFSSAESGTITPIPYALALISFFAAYSALKGYISSKLPYAGAVIATYAASTATEVISASFTFVFIVVGVIIGASIDKIKRFQKSVLLALWNLVAMFILILAIRSVDVLGEVGNSFSVHAAILFLGCIPLTQVNQICRWQTMT